MSAIDYKALAERIAAMARSYEYRSRIAHTTMEGRVSERHAECTADLRTLVALLEGMVQAEPFAWAVRDTNPLFPEPGPWNIFYQTDEPYIAWTHHEKVPLYVHPAPQPQAEQSPEGWRPVPVEPTEEMVDAGCDVDARAEVVKKFAAKSGVLDPESWVSAGEVLAVQYRAMLAAAPTPPAQAERQQKCGCRSCLTPAELMSTFVVCPKCGDKRCPRADDHRNACTDSNDQPQPERQPVREQADDESDLVRIRDVMRKYGWQSRDCCEEILALFQPQPVSEPTEAQNTPAPFLRLYDHAYGMSLGVDWNKGTHAAAHRAPLLDAVSECKRWLDSAPQPQPEPMPKGKPGFVQQIENSRENVKAWPQWMQDATVESAATMPKFPAPQPERQPVSEPTEAQIEYEILCNGEWVASASGPGAEAEILRYLTHYEQDGPCEVYAVTRRLVLRAALAAK